MNLSLVGNFPYRAKCVGVVPYGAGVVISFEIRDASGALHNGVGIDESTVQPTLDLAYDPQQGIPAAELFAQIPVAIRKLQIAEAGSELAWIEAAIAQGFAIEA